MELVTRDMRRQLRRDNMKWPIELREIPQDDWPDSLRSAPLREHPKRVWRSRRFLVMLFQPTIERTRLSVCHTEHDGDRWRDGIGWNDLQRLKREAGYGDVWAVEIYPDDREVVDVADMRHLWLLPEAPPFAWRRNGDR